MPRLVSSDWITAGQALKYKISKLQVKGNFHVSGVFINVSKNKPQYIVVFQSSNPDLNSDNDNKKVQTRLAVYRVKP